ncbi:hypothetical protein QWY16_11680 [Planococcus shenhongbingii]|uniref:hypothetical protein n=1 Tax=Planococcus shenhongbingii TaxID=3058398 RepID=UPI002604FB4C|nr:hypothetical protein [Planococcus sp. N016]WKA57161.1 hypothetical protein QWY16_11680 [Planococcus sp. N016]
MSFESIKELLKTMRFYHTVNIVQSFHRGEKACLTVKCVKNTRTLEVTFIDTAKVEYFDCFEAAAAAIHQAINPNTQTQTS